MDTDGYDPYPSIRVDAAGVAFEVFVTEILSRDPEIELVSASLRGDRSLRNQLRGGAPGQDPAD